MDAHDFNMKGLMHTVLRSIMMFQSVVSTCGEKNPVPSGAVMHQFSLTSAAVMTMQGLFAKLKVGNKSTKMSLKILQLNTMPLEQNAAPDFLT
jgi:hypothetical protein